MLFPDGTKYMGMWKTGKKHGQGTLTLSDGEKMSGEWKENKEWNITKYDANEKIIAKFTFLNILQCLENKTVLLM